MARSWVVGGALPWWRAAGWRGRLVVAVVALQFLVPLIALTLERPVRFGFQMFSGFGAVRLLVTDHSGERREVAMEDVAVSYRAEIDWLQRMPEHLCHVEPDAVSATVEQHGRSRTVSCER